MSKHTPGPWEWVGDCLESHNDYVLGVGDDGKQFGMHSAVLIESSFATRAEANRYLIAAAPELLASLIEMLAEAEGWLDDSRGCKPDGLMEHGAFDRAYAIIAKATGGEA